MRSDMVGSHEEECLKPLLAAHWSVEACTLTRLPAGHTNKSYLVQTANQLAVLRQSWPGKPQSQLLREAAVLRLLQAQQSAMPALPRLRHTAAGEAWAQTAGGSCLHLFEYIGGYTGTPSVHAAMQALTRLHAALARLPAHSQDPLDWLRQRHARVAARAQPPLPEGLATAYPAVLSRIGVLLQSARPWMSGPIAWVHGDFHAGNLLQNTEGLQAILDFDETGEGSQALECAFALFALCRDAAVESHLHYDIPAWQSGAALLGHQHWLLQHREALSLLFCADQTLIHLEAAQRGLWTLQAGIGFLANWNSLLSGLPAQP